MVKHYRIRKGVPTGQGPVARQEVVDRIVPTEIAYLGADFPGLRPRFAVEAGTRVDAGQVLFIDRRQEAVTFVSPVAGVVAETAFGPRRTLSIVRVRVDGEARADGPPPVDADARDTLLARGLWPVFRARPFGHVPAPDVVPRAIVVNAVATGSGAPDPTVVLDGQGAAFERGLSVLTRLTDGRVFVAQSSKAPLGEATDRVVYAQFSGTAAAGLPGTQIDRLCPVGASGEVWSVGYQDVVSIGHLFLSGRYDPTRIVSVSGGEGGARLVRTMAGARLADLVASEDRAWFSGRAGIMREGLFLGQGHDCVSLEPHVRRSAPQRRRADRVPVDAIIPNRRVETAVAVDVPTVPLMKALALADADRAAALGCLGLIEEDVATLTPLCTSGTDYAASLRAVLDTLEAAA